MRPLRRLRLLACLTVLASAALRAPLGATAGVTHPYLGVSYIDRTDTTPRAEHMHIVQVDLGAPGVRVRDPRPAIEPPAHSRLDPIPGRARARR